MPTAAKLIACLAFAAVGFFTAEIYKPGYDEAQQWGWFTSVSALIGAICGWRIAGREAGRGWGHAISIGLKTSAVMLFFALVIFSIELMLGRAQMKYYGGIFDAIMGTFDIILMYGTAFLRNEPMITLFVGGIGAALLTEWTKRQAE